MEFRLERFGKKATVRGGLESFRYWEQVHEGEIPRELLVYYSLLREEDLVQLLTHHSALYNGSRLQSTDLPLIPISPGSIHSPFRKEKHILKRRRLLSY